jgi:hypothetical protein
MANPRFLSVVKVIDPNSQLSVQFDIKDRDRFIYFGDFPNDPTRCFVFGLNCGKRIAWMSSEHFVEVDPIDF